MSHLLSCQSSRQVAHLGVSPELARCSPRAHVDIYVAQLDALAHIGAEVLNALSADERDRAEQFADPVHRRRYALSHYCVRKVLARHYDVEARDLPLSTSLAGRPFLRASPIVDFSLSHCGNLAVIAVSADSIVGVDIEQVDAAAARELAERVLTSRERAAVASVACDEQARRFFDFWVVKEAFAKLNGLGLAIDFTSVEASSEDSGQVRYLGPSRDVILPRAWVRKIDVAPAMACALVAAARPTSVSVTDVSPVLCAHSD